MNRQIVVARIKRQQAELDEMIEMLKEEKEDEKLVDILKRRYGEMQSLLEAMEDKSVIPKGQEDVDITPELDRISKKVEVARDVIQKIKELGDEENAK